MRDKDSDKKSVNARLDANTRSVKLFLACGGAGAFVVAAERG